MNGGRVGEVVLHVGGNAVASEGVLRHVHPLGDSPRRCLADGGACVPITSEVLPERMVVDGHGGKRGMRFSDFCALPISLFCKLSEAEVFAVRYYTTLGFSGINTPLRDQERRKRKQPHKLAVLVFILDRAIRKLRAWAGDTRERNEPKDLFRGMGKRQIFEKFMVEGGTVCVKERDRG